jgi:hypothetical protein
MPVEEGKEEEEEQRHTGVERGEAERGKTGGLPCSSKSRSEDSEDDIMSAEAGEGSASGGGLSDSDDDSMPTFSCKVTEDLKCKQRL